MVIFFSRRWLTHTALIVYITWVTVIWLLMYCKVTGRRHRVSPCRSAYFASPWWLLTLDLWRHSREAALLFPESWWHLTMRGSRPSLFMMISNTKRHPIIRKRTNSNPNFELVFVSRIPQIRLKKSVTEILWRRFCDRNPTLSVTQSVTEILLRRFCDRNSHTL